MQFKYFNKYNIQFKNKQQTQKKQQMLKPISFLVIFLVYKTYCDPANLAYCQQIPYNPITPCNLTCASCQSRNICLSCPQYLNLTDVSCNIPKTKTMFYNEYFYQSSLKNDRNLSLFQFSNGFLTSDQTFQFCIADLYRFDVIGLFSRSDQIRFTASYDFQIDYIDLSFRLFFSTSLAIVKIQINSILIYSNTFSSGSTLNFTKDRQVDSSNTKWYLGIITSDPSAYVDQIFVPVRTGFLALNSKQANIKITVQDGQINQSQQNKFWGISQIKVLSQQCSTCLAQFLVNMSRTLGYIILISAGVVFVSVGFLAYYERVILKNKEENGGLLKDQSSQTKDKKATKNKSKKDIDSKKTITNQKHK